MPRSRPFAGIVALAKFAARAWAPFVDVAMCALTDAAAQRGASRRSVVSAAQAGGVVVDDVGQSVGYSAAVLQQLCHREINTETGAAGAAGLAM